MCEDFWNRYKDFSIMIRLHQIVVLSPYLFISCWIDLPSTPKKRCFGSMLLFVDDIVLVKERIKYEYRAWVMEGYLGIQ